MLNTPVPTKIGIPKITRSLTPIIWSFLPWRAASNKWSAVFSKDANVNTDSFIFSIPNRVMPNTCPLKLSITTNIQSCTSCNLPITSDVGYQSTNHNCHIYKLHSPSFNFLRIRDFLNQDGTCCLDAQHLKDLHHMIGDCLSMVHTYCAHDLQ